MAVWIIAMVVAMTIFGLMFYPTVRYQLTDSVGGAVEKITGFFTFKASEPHEAIIDGKIKFTVDSVTEVDYAGPSSIPKEPDEGYKFLEVNLTAENVGNERWSVVEYLEVATKIEMKDETRYNPASLYSSLKRLESLPSSIRPEEEKKGRIVFEVLEDKEPKHLIFYKDHYSEKVDFIDISEFAEGN